MAVAYAAGRASRTVSPKIEESFVPEAGRFITEDKPGGAQNYAVSRPSKQLYEEEYRD
jgi:hypothetical protein